MELRNYAHCVVGANLHLQFTPAYRRDIFCDSGVKSLCKRVFGAVSGDLGVELIACEFGPDHAHLFLSGWKNYSIPYLVRLLKGRSSRTLRKNMWEQIRPKLWGDRFWSEGYFAETVGRITAETAKQYIERQQGKHWMKPNLKEHHSQVRITQF
jgi:putative transposase